MTRPYGKLKDFVEDLYALRSAGYVYKRDYAQRLNISEACFERRMIRARQQGLLPSAQQTQIFDPFGENNAQ